MDKTLQVAICIVIATALIGGYLLFGPNSPGSEGKNGKTSKIIIKDFDFTPANITVKEGTTVTWINKDLAEHMVKSRTFTSPKLDTDQKYEFKFTKKGTYVYVCGIHTFMKGKVVVK